MSKQRKPAVFLLACLAVPALALRGPAQEKPPEEKWKVSTELSYVVTGGNASTSSFSLGSKLSKTWDRNTVAFRTYVLKSNATTKNLQAVGSETDYEIVENKVEQLVAENYVLEGQYSRRLTGKLTGQAGASWDRNRFAGIAARYILTAGVGDPVTETKRTTLKTEAAATVTLRRYIGDRTTSFAGLRAVVSFEQKINDKSSITSLFVFDDNLKKTVDWRFDWTNAVSAPISKSLALKTSLRTLYTNFPALKAVPLVDTYGNPLGLFVYVPLKKLDLFFTNSIVISF
jgi:putative salt-induced outer membrane protein YdiY